MPYTGVAHGSKVTNMKIDNSYTQGLSVALNKKPVERKGDKAEAPASSELKLSGLATALSGAEQTNEGAPINQARINEIKAAISSGSFKINPEAIADSLINTAKDLVNARSKTA